MQEQTEEPDKRKPVSGCMMIFITAFIVLVLGLMAIPNFLEPCTRSTVSRVKADMRILATAIESYAIDYDTYPPHTFQHDKKAHWPASLDAPTFMNNYCLSTPVPYISSYPLDALSSESAEKFGFAYYNFAGSWLLVSQGPHHDFDTRFDLLSTSSPLTAASSRTLHFAEATEGAVLMFDPSNGTLSSGDIYLSRDEGYSTIFSDSTFSTKHDVSSATTETLE